VLNAIYEEDFLGFGYGFRCKRGQHNALDALVVGITSRPVNFIFDADVASVFLIMNPLRHVANLTICCRPRRLRVVFGLKST
jgi:hypothetical protein